MRDCFCVYFFISQFILQSIAESSRRPGLRSADTADYIKRRTRTKFRERCFSHSGPAVWIGIPYLAALSLPLTLLIDIFKKTIFKKKNLSIPSRVLTFVSAPGQFECRAI